MHHCLSWPCYGDYEFVQTTGQGPQRVEEGCYEMARVSHNPTKLSWNLERRVFASPRSDRCCLSIEGHSGEATPWNRPSAITWIQSDWVRWFCRCGQNLVSGLMGEEHAIPWVNTTVYHLQMDGLMELFNHMSLCLQDICTGTYWRITVDVWPWRSIAHSNGRYSSRFVVDLSEYGEVLVTNLTEVREHVRKHGPCRIIELTLNSVQLTSKVKHLFSWHWIASDTALSKLQMILGLLKQGEYWVGSGLLR